MTSGELSVTRLFIPVFVLAVAVAVARLPSAEPPAESRQATGVKVGEVTDTSAIVWMRLTAKATRNNDGVVRRGKVVDKPVKDNEVDGLEGACPGAAGEMRVRYGEKQDLSDAKATDWAVATAQRDFSHQFPLKDLKPGTVYHYATETAGPGRKEIHAPLRGQFQTAPPARDHADVTFTVLTGQAYKDIDHKDGFHIYDAMGRLQPRFLVPTGDTVYYDNEDPIARTVPLARYHWDRMYSYPRHINFHLRFPGYWEKDDHDTLSNDCWPSLKPKFMLPMTFEDGLRIFREQVPMGEKTWRTARWGEDLQVWMTEGRDYRSPNTMADGPKKTIWGEEQKKWFKESVLASDATWKVLVNPTPIVGPDRGKKADSHANDAFKHEGDELRQWMQKNAPDNLFIACGDRHWQYHSVHPETGVQEFSCGPASDEHASGSPGEDPRYHKFHREKGGFLSVTVKKQGDKSQLTFRLHDVHGKVVHEYSRER